ncbi:MAG: AraC family transcriptional regulator [Victivallaceae bacterium]|nr:AraC family transcriptional regulator [Victivallaceae bacterium]
MYIWEKSFQVYQPLASFPTPRHIAEEVQTNSLYYCESHLRHGNTLLFVCTLKGRGIFRTDGIEYDLLPGTAFICRDLELDVAWYYPDRTTIPWQFFWLNFQGEAADAMMVDLVARYGHLYQVDIQHAMLMKLSSFQKSSGRICNLSPAEGAKLIFDLLGYLATVASAESSSAPQNILVKNAQILMLQQLESPLTIADFAEQLSISREHFTRIFKLQTDTTPAEYLLRHKMLHACKLLKETNLSCKEIAMRLGYSNATNFTRAFRKRQNSTPQYFRQSGAMPIF